MAAIAATRTTGTGSLRVVISGRTENLSVDAVGSIPNITAQGTAPAVFAFRDRIEQGLSASVTFGSCRGRPVSGGAGRVSTSGRGMSIRGQARGLRMSAPSHSVEGQMLTGAIKR